SGSGSASPPPSEGPPQAAEAYCLTGADGAQPLCYDTAKEANAAKAGLTTTATEKVWCLTPTAPEPSPTPTPSPTGSTAPSASLGPSASASATPSPAVSGQEA